MVDRPTIDRMRVAAEAAEHVQGGLRRRQDDLYELDARSRNMGPLSDPRTIIDQAEEVRRAIQIQREDYVSEIAHGLRSAQDLTMQAGLDGDLSPERARTLARVVETASAETRRLELDLNDAARALEPMSQATVRDRDFATTAATSISEANSLVESAQRATFRVVQDLPDISRELEQTAADRDQHSEIDVNVEVDMPDVRVQCAQRSAHQHQRSTFSLSRPINTAAPGI